MCDTAERVELRGVKQPCKIGKSPSCILLRKPEEALHLPIQP